MIDTPETDQGVESTERSRRGLEMITIYENKEKTEIKQIRLGSYQSRLSNE